MSKRGIFNSFFRKNTTAQKPVQVYMPIELILNKKAMCLPRVSSLKKIVLKRLYRTVYTFIVNQSMYDGTDFILEAREVRLKLTYIELGRI
jgi:hypothetical protein